MYSTSFIFTNFTDLFIDYLKPLFWLHKLYNVDWHADKYEYRESNLKMHIEACSSLVSECNSSVVFLKSLPSTIWLLPQNYRELDGVNLSLRKSLRLN
jgi:hypothetical protein